jgi:hypothetical protein
MGCHARFIPGLASDSSHGSWNQFSVAKMFFSLICLGLAAGSLAAAGPSQASIANSQIQVKLYLPDAQGGYYRGTRFDWSGVIRSLVYKGHDFYGPWFSSVDPSVHDFVFKGPEIVASPCTADLGPVDEFETNGKALGWDDAKPGGTFIKIGVGVLRKDDAPYDHFKLYPIVDPGTWTVTKHRDSIEFTQELSDPSSGYAYVYRKTVRLVKGQPEMILDHSLKNTGRRTLQSTVYNHNFLVLDKQPPGPDFTITFPFLIQSDRPQDEHLARIRGNRIEYVSTLQGQQVVLIHMRGFSDSPKDNHIRIENRKLGVGMTIASDRPLSDLSLWSIRAVLAVEPFIAMNIPPGGEFTWRDLYKFYTLPARPN